MKSISTGNLNARVRKNLKTRGWVIGHFMPLSSLFHSQDVEIKWGREKKGTVYNKAKTNLRAKTFAVLLQGRVEIFFPDENKKISLRKMGDFVFWSAGIPHTMKVTRDSVIMTIRWPSIKDDVILNPYD